MERRSIQLLSRLREGDRFTFPKRLDVWEVMKPQVKGKVEVNQIINGKQKFKFNEFKNGTTPVLFLRHTKPLEGEECFVEDLQEGDVFCKPNDIITEYVVLNKGHEFYKVRKVLDKAASEPQMAGRLASVVFVRSEPKKEEGQK